MSQAKISARKTAPLVELGTGERVLMVGAKPQDVPAEADGVLLTRNGRPSWLWHRKLEAFKLAWAADPSGLRDQARSSWVTAFKLVNPTNPPDSSERLRPPQSGALCAIAAHWTLSTSPATIVMPTGTGKTETILAAFAGLLTGTTLVTVPSRTLRQQTVDKFMRLGLLRELGVLPADVPNPIVGIIEHQPRTREDLEFIRNCDVVVGVINSMAQGAAANLISDLAAMCDTLILDEAHHVAAATWSALRESFSARRVLQFTATPFRRDGELVDGKVIYNYPLKKAQDDGYFKPIYFHSIREAERSEADVALATRAIAQLRSDLAEGLDHILMARCDTIARATELHGLYTTLATDLAPILVHSHGGGALRALDPVERRASRIIVCVDMLGEGFDLPELKVAAIHDTHKSLAVLLQFAGRFTRTKASKIGDANVFANIADQRVATALERLYSEDADWNHLLAEFSSEAITAHIELVEFLRDAERIDEPRDEDPTRSLTLKSFKPKFSTLVFSCDRFQPKRFKDAIGPRETVAGVWVNSKAGVLVFIRRTDPPVGWLRAKSIRDVVWDLVLIYYDRTQHLLFIASSDRDGSFLALARAVGGPTAQQVSGDRTFRSLGGISRLLFQNIGLKRYGGRRALSFSLYSGRDVAYALSAQQRSSSTKSNVSGSGFEHGAPVTIGCSYRGRVWSRDQGNVVDFMHWARGIGKKLNDDSIVTDDIIEHVLVPRVITEFPLTAVLCLDWPRELLDRDDARVELIVGDNEFVLADLSPSFESLSADRKRMTFSVTADDAKTLYEYELTGSDYRVHYISGPKILMVRPRGGEQDLHDWFSDFPPNVVYVDGAELEGDALVEPKTATLQPVPEQQFNVAWNWKGVDLARESIWKSGTWRANSIQARAFETMKAEGFDVIIDDDGAGEAADLVCLREMPDHLRLVLVHCKYSGGSEPGHRVKDVEEVCAQAIRSSRWIWKIESLFSHIEKRDASRRKRGGATRFLAGEAKTLRKLHSALRFKEVRSEIVIVQPGLSYAGLSTHQSTILSGTNGFLLDTIQRPLHVVCSP